MSIIAPAVIPKIPVIFFIVWFSLRVPYPYAVLTVWALPLDHIIPACALQFLRPPVQFSPQEQTRMRQATAKHLNQL